MAFAIVKKTIFLWALYKAFLYIMEHIHQFALFFWYQMCLWMCLIGLNCSGYCIFLGILTSDSGLNSSFIKSQPTSPSKLG